MRVRVRVRVTEEPEGLLDADAHLPGADLSATPRLSTCLEASNSHLDAQGGGC